MSLPWQIGSWAACLLLGCANNDAATKDTSSRGGSAVGANGGTVSLGGTSSWRAGATGGLATSRGESPVTLGGTSNASGKASAPPSGESSGGTVVVGSGGSTATGGNLSGTSSAPRGGSSSMGGVAGSSSSADVIANFENGIVWNDTRGKRLEAHGGGFILVDGTWYWIGEDKSENSGNFKAVNCYSSTNLNDWQFERAIITKSTSIELNTADRIIERPKVVYNETTKQYVMWLHWEGASYAEAKAGVFSSDTVCGAYSYKSAFRPNGNMSRDATLFKDDDGKAYFLSAANENADLVLYELSADYLTVARQVTILWAGAKREAPAVFKRDGRYYIITSACTGWDPNQAQYATANAITGPWSTRTNLASSTTYDTQSTFVIPIQGTKTTTYIYVGDRWQDPDLVGSKYVFLPLKVSGTSLNLDYYDKWQLNLTTGNWSVNDGYLPQSDWSVLYVDSEETAVEDGRGTRAFDGSGQTFWHTEYTNQKPAYPHELQIDLGAPYDIEGLRYLPRQDKDANGMVAKYEFYVSADAKNFGTAVTAGTFLNTRNETIVRFPQKTGRYIRFVALTPITESNLASVGELDLLGTMH